MPISSRAVWRLPLSREVRNFATVCLTRGLPFSRSAPGRSGGEDKYAYGSKKALRPVAAVTAVKLPTEPARAGSFGSRVFGGQRLGVSWPPAARGVHPY